jgi:hypothetical protein
VFEALFDPGWLERRPITMAADYPGTDRSDVARSVGAGSDPSDPTREASFEKLRSLGYIR